MTRLSFDTLRRANKARLPLFRNRHGLPAHSQPDGSDWSPAQWFQAMLGELGEVAEQRLLYESGAISFHEYAANVAKEIADVQCCLDLFAARALDEVAPSPNPSAAQTLMVLVRDIGLYAGDRKKFDRGDHESDQFKVRCHRAMNAILSSVDDLQVVSGDVQRNALADRVIKADPFGVNLGTATEAKWNEISERIGCSLRILYDGIYKVD